MSTLSNTDVSSSPDAKLESLLQRINGLVESPRAEPSNKGSAPTAAPAALRKEATTEFVPQAPRSFPEAGIAESSVEEIVCKYLLSKGEATGRDISEQVKLPFPMIETLLARMKYDQLIGYIGQSTMNDYVCKLSDIGRERARNYNTTSTYFGAAPVPLRDYVASVKAQSIEGQHPTQADLKRAFSDLLIDERMLGRLGPAVNSGRGMFLFGYPGNGKTSIAERVTSAFGPYIWVPRAIGIDGEIVRFFDPMNHEEAPKEVANSLLQDKNIDRRWIRIKRPTIVVGGELTMEHLEIAFNAATGTSEAPIQLKSNCGTLVIDDFGRQRMSVDELLNRWIVPLEKRHDYLSTSSGKKVQVPFDQLVIFSTNLEPKDLVDDAFLRRIPYKIEVPNPSEEHFRKLFEIMAKKFGMEFRPKALDHLIENHYKPVGRPFRNCHPRDLLLQIRNFCKYNNFNVEMTEAGFDFAADNYFSIM
jgi:hypothetical protein